MKIIHSIVATTLILLVTSKMEDPKQMINKSSPQTDIKKKLSKHRFKKESTDDTDSNHEEEKEVEKESDKPAEEDETELEKKEDSIITSLVF